METAEDAEWQAKAAQGKEKFSREQSKGKEYSGKNVDWAVESGIITEKERISFFHKVADINKLGHKYRRAKNGDYIVDLGGKLLFTNADWYSPSLNIVISFNDSFENSMLYAKEIIFNEAKSEANYNRARQAIETAYWQGYVEFSYSRDYQTNVRENAGRERKNSQRNNGEDVSYSREPETLSELRRREDSFSDCVFSAFSSRHPHQGCFLAYMGKTVTDQPAQFQTKNMNKS